MADKRSFAERAAFVFLAPLIVFGALAVAIFLAIAFGQRVARMAFMAAFGRAFPL